MFFIPSASNPLILYKISGLPCSINLSLNANVTIFSLCPISFKYSRTPSPKPPFLILSSIVTILNPSFDKEFNNSLSIGFIKVAFIIKISIFFSSFIFFPK